MKKICHALASRALALLFCVPVLAGAQTIVDAAHVQAALQRGAQVWDVRDANDYAKGHLPGALNLGDAAKLLRDPNTEDFIAISRLEAMLGAAGIDPSRETVVYGSRGTWNAYFGRYTLRYFGGDQVTVFHDGIEGWQAAGMPVSTSVAPQRAVQLKLVPHPAVAVTTAEVIRQLNNPAVQLIDARTPKEFAGEDIRALRGGHIPGAINIPYEQNWIDPDTQLKLAQKKVIDTRGMALKTSAELKALYAKLDPEKETVVYCQSGVRASETAGVLEQLGFKKVRVYDSSWLAYGNQLDAPANNVTVFNVGALNGRLAGLQSRIDMLEKELASAKK
jgi:thiosulfate/3-mercaptopyruvate sulfurtransferase